MMATSMTFRLNSSVWLHRLLMVLANTLTGVQLLVDFFREVASPMTCFMSCVRKSGAQFQFLPDADIFRSRVDGRQRMADFIHSPVGISHEQEGLLRMVRQELFHHGFQGHRRFFLSPAARQAGSNPGPVWLSDDTVYFFIQVMPVEPYGRVGGRWPYAQQQLFPFPWGGEQAEQSRIGLVECGIHVARFYGIKLSGRNTSAFRCL